jgi:hypothetical protein
MGIAKERSRRCAAVPNSASPSGQLRTHNNEALGDWSPPRPLCTARTHARRPLFPKQGSLHQASEVERTRVQVRKGNHEVGTRAPR